MHRRRLQLSISSGLAALALVSSVTQAQEIQFTPAKTAASPTVAKAYGLFSPIPGSREQAIADFATEKNKLAIPVLIQALRFARSDAPDILKALRAITGENAGNHWHEWMLWQEARPGNKAPHDFVAFKAMLYSRIDANFRLFLYPKARHTIRIEEIVWGGVIKDGIPALTNPKLTSAAAASYITPDELVFGIEINGDARAYPLRMLDWHEMFNDVVGDVPVSLAYCTLCGSGILFETAVKGRNKPFVFGSSGFLYRSNKLMYDKETNSLWNQFTGKPVVGKLVGSGIELKTRPVVITSWSRWHKQHPDTRVLSLKTGFRRDYTPGKPYGSYFKSHKLMFPALVDETKLRAKDYVFALRGSGHEKAWPLSYFETSPVINDTAGALQVTLVGDAATRSVRAYRTTGERFAPGQKTGTLTVNGEAWRVTEAALAGPSGQAFTRLPGHIAFWFAWSNYFGTKGELAQRPGSTPK